MRKNQKYDRDVTSFACYVAKGLRAVPSMIEIQFRIPIPSLQASGGVVL
jgi:hypothetical protein